MVNKVQISCFLLILNKMNEPPNHKNGNTLICHQVLCFRTLQTFIYLPAQNIKLKATHAG